MGRIAVITGAAGGIGSATALAFKAAGWTTVGLDRNRPTDCGLDRYIELNLGSRTVASELADLLAEMPQIDALINNAAMQITKPLAETTAEEWHDILHVNVVAAALLLRASTPHMKPGSAVINIGSVHSIATSPGMAAYVASKGAVTALTRAAALELAPLGIRVNCVLPGAVDTPMLRHGLAREEGDVLPAMDALAAKTPLGRIGRPEDIAEAVLFLADSKRSSFITGQSLVVDGGATARLATE